MEQRDELERLMKKLGEFGCYQKFQFFLQVVATIPTSMAMLSLVILAAVPEHRCTIPGVDNSSYTEPWNSSRVIESIPRNGFGKLDSCHRYALNNTVEQCDSWVYDSEYYKSSRGIEWNFVCDRRWMGATTQAIVMLGVFIGSVVLGSLCDTFGRRTVFLWAATLQLICGTADAFTTDFYALLILRFIYGIFCMSPAKAGYVLMVELVGPSKRAFCGAAFQVVFGLGVALLGIWGYFIRDRFYLQLVYTAHVFLMLPQWFLLDESPRWLWAKGRVSEAVAIVEKGLKMNNYCEKVDTELHILNRETLSKNRSHNIIDLFKTPKMARRTLILCGCWLAVAVVYFGLAMNTGKLNGNPFFILTVSGLVEIPGYILGVLFINKFGNRAPLSSTMLLSGVACFITVALPQQSTLVTVAAMIGKLISCASYALIYKYSAELFPTILRSTGVGLGSMCASLSASITPFISLLDAFRPEIPTIVFGLSALIFGFCCMFLPETRGRRLPQTLEDGELFGKGDTCFTNCRGRSLSESSGSAEVRPLR